MSVKFIFKAIIGTIAIIIVSCLVIELFNVFVVTNQLQMMQRVAARQACVLFSQETFKRDDTELATPDIKDASGVILVSGKFYTGTDTKSIYNNLFLTSTKKNEIKTFANKIKAANGGDIPWSSFDSWYRSVQGESNIYGDLYKESYVTPLNMGITYLDKNTISNIYRWNLATILKNNSTTDSGSGKSNLGRESGAAYVDYRGFRIWLNSTNTQISDIQYKLYDLSDLSDSTEFYKITNIGETGEKYSDLIGIDDADERNNVVVASVNYKCAVSYRGITPLRHIINYATNHRVAGFKGTSKSIGKSDVGTIGTYSKRSTLDQDGGTNRLTSGSIKYYVIR